MKLFLRSALLILSVLALLCAISMGLPRSQIVPDYLNLLGLSKCGDSFCIMGLQPGKTSWDVAKPTLLAFPNATEDVDGGITIDASPIKNYFWQDLRGTEMVADMTSDSASEIMTAGQFVETFGVPCSLTITDDSIYLLYPHLIAQVAMTMDNDAANLAPQSPVSDISPGEPVDCSRLFNFPAGRNIRVLWCGFETVQYYLAKCEDGNWR